MKAYRGVSKQALSLINTSQRIVSAKLLEAEAEKLYELAQSEQKSMMQLATEILRKALANSEASVTA